MCKERISTGQIHQQICTVPGAYISLGGCYGLTRPVSGMLIHSGQIIKKRAFSDVGITGKRYHRAAGCDFFIPASSFGISACRIISKSHKCAHSGKTVMSLQSFPLKAITAPRIRYAEGSPPGLLPTHSTTVSGISPRSSRRRLMLEGALTLITLAKCPGIISLR